MADAVYFGPYHLDTGTGELYKGGSRIRLQQHPLSVLIMLAERPGELVTREEIRSRLWPHGTIVEFDHSINSAVNKLRAALADTAERPRYIETVARKGYRLIVPVLREVIPDKIVESPTAAASLTGTQVSHYRVLELIGGGGMGLVYKAVDLNLDRNVALKILPEEAETEPAARERFQREARAISALDHPNICTVYEFGEHGGRPFLAMQLLDGHTVKERLAAGGAFESELLTTVALGIAEALEAAHRRGIVHRDIKPANIFLTRAGQVKVLDFGLAKLLETHDAGIPGGTHRARDGAQAPLLLTLTGAFQGTAAYMSPEQIRGERVDARTDIFSFGLVLYEMATGRHAFGGSSAAEIHQAILEAEPGAPAAVNPNVSPELERVILKALKKNREARYASAADLRQALEEARERGGKPAPVRLLKKRWLQAGAVALLALAAAAIAGRSLFRHTAPQQPEPSISVAVPGGIQSIAVLPFRAIQGQSRNEILELGLADTLITRLSGTGELVVRPTGAVRRYAEPSQDPVAAGRDLKVDVVVDASVQREGAGVRITARLLRVSDARPLWAATFDEKAGNLFVVEDSIAGRIVEALSVPLSAHANQLLAKHYTLNAEAHELYLTGRYFWNRRTKGGYEKAIGYFQQAIQKDPAYALAYAGVADCYLLMGDYGKPKELMPLAAAAARKAMEIDPALAEAHASLGLIAMNYHWDWGKSESEFQRALELNPNYSTAHQWYGDYLGYMGRFDESLAELKRAHELDPLSSIINADTAEMLYYARRYDQAIEQSKKTLEMDPGFAPAYQWLGGSYWCKGMREEALAAMEKADQLREVPDEISIGAFCRALLRNRTEALERLERLRKAWTNGAVHAIQIAFHCMQLGEKDEAFTWIERGLQERSNWVTTLKCNPMLDPLRSDPRYAALLKRLGLER